MIFNSILIANRGEIACRIIKTAKEMGIKSVAVYVDADKDALFVKQADQSVRLKDGGYLDGNRIIDAAIIQNAAELMSPGITIFCPIKSLPGFITMFLPNSPLI